MQTKKNKKNSCTLLSDDDMYHKVCVYNYKRSVIFDLAILTVQAYRCMWLKCLNRTIQVSAHVQKNCLW